MLIFKFSPISSYLLNTLNFFQMRYLHSDCIQSAIEKSAMSAAVAASEDLQSDLIPAVYEGKVMA